MRVVKKPITPFLPSLGLTCPPSVVSQCEDSTDCLQRCHGFPHPCHHLSESV